MLRPGGRIGISDIVADNELTASQRAEREPTSVVSQARCHSRSTKRDFGLRGSTISITSTYEYLPGIHSAIVKATKSSAVGQSVYTAPVRAQRTCADREALKQGV